MNIAPRYLGRGSRLARRDPRVLILVVVMFIFTVLQIWDGRIIFALLVLSVFYYRSASIPWRQIRRNWTIVFPRPSVDWCCTASGAKRLWSSCQSPSLIASAVQRHCAA